MVCNGMYWYVLVCNGMYWYVMVWYGMIWYGIVCIVLYCIVLYCTVFYCIVLYEWMNDWWWWWWRKINISHRHSLADRYTGHITMPFKSLRFKALGSEWAANGEWLAVGGLPIVCLFVKYNTNISIIWDCSTIPFLYHYYTIINK